MYPEICIPNLQVVRTSGTRFVSLILKQAIYLAIYDRKMGIKDLDFRKHNSRGSIAEIQSIWGAARATFI